MIARPTPQHRLHIDFSWRLAVAGAQRLVNPCVPYSVRLPQDE